MKHTKSGGKRILVVEDEPGISRVCVKVLTAEGFEVDIANNGLIAKDMVKKEEYDLCIIDIRTPEMNGMELYEYLKKSYPELAGAVIFTTGDVMSTDAQGFLEQADRPFLPKPFSPDELTNIIRDTLLQEAHSIEHGEQELKS